MHGPQEHYAAARPRPFDVTHRMVMAIAIPMSLAAVTTPLLGVVDTAVIGQYGKAELIGGLAIGALVFDFLLSTFNFLRSGTTGLVAQAMGRGDLKEEQAVFWRAFIIAVVTGVLMILCLPLINKGAIWFMDPEPAIGEAMTTYVVIRMFSAPVALINYAILGLVLGRGEGMLGLALQFLLNGINIVMSITLGLLLEWGVAGVAWGTVTGEFIAALVGMIIVVRKFRAAPVPSRGRIFDAAGMLRMFTVNRDIMIRSFLLLTAFSFFTRAGAELGPIVLAANAVLMNFFLVAGFFLDGIATAAEQISGRAVGARYRPAFLRGAKLTFLWGMLLAMGITVFFMVLGNPIIRLMTNAADVRAAAAVYLPWAALTALTGLLAFHMDGVYIGATWSRDMRNMMLLSLLAFFAVLYAAKPLGNHGLWLAINFFLSIRGVTLLAMLPRRLRTEFGY
ncbi:MATE family efflux transporter [Mesorhizobium sp. RMAD-H1]|uniref:MATE family efflux transporter n=1 Tax=Mesorhizobium sp. RMAD-H1 TaxID=2587065 RepID=UPI0016202D17|nr:MATE family efflux transporter [Mesorhizobium sp. RMAD-H1]MBB2969653.1 putative MATE family efflux protein [Mesorhizobium sp. RMAD-H1]